MKKFVAVVFTFNGKLIMQRRDKDAPNNPNMLGFFGGLVEKGEESRDAIKREIAEETSLDSDSLALKHMFDVEIPVNTFESERATDSVFKCALESFDFVVKEGKGAEAYSLNELRHRKDIAPYSTVIIERLNEVEV